MAELCFYLVKFEFLCGGDCGLCNFSDEANEITYFTGVQISADSLHRV